MKIIKYMDKNFIEHKMIPRKSKMDQFFYWNVYAV
jgi:hypothetical protein